MSATTLEINIQSSFENEYLKIEPLQETDFDRLFSIANDPKVWEQHPNPNRYQKPVFETYFKGAIESKGAFIIVDKKTNDVIGSTRFYQLEKDKKNIFIGYTFVGLKYWGQEHNRDVKKILVNYAFQFLDTVQFHIGVNNIRSQMAIAKLGAVKIGSEEISYYGEIPQLNFIFELNKTNWLY